MSRSYKSHALFIIILVATNNRVNPVDIRHPHKTVKTHLMQCCDLISKLQHPLVWHWIHIICPLSPHNAADGGHTPHLSSQPNTLLLPCHSIRSDKMWGPTWDYLWENWLIEPVLIFRLSFISKPIRNEDICMSIRTRWSSMNFQSSSNPHNNPVIYRILDGVRL